METTNVDNYDFSWLDDSECLSNKDKQLGYVEYLKYSKTGKKLYRKLRNLDLRKLVAKFTFNPKKPNNILTITHHLEGIDNNLIAIEGFITKHDKCEFNHWIVIQWLFDVIFNKHAFDRNYTPRVNDIRIGDSSYQRITVSRGVNIDLNKSELIVNGVRCTIYECRYLVNLADYNGRIIMVLSKNDLTSLVTLANYSYPFTKYITDCIKERISSLWISNAYINKELTITHDKIYSELLDALDPNLRNVYSV